MIKKIAIVTDSTCDLPPEWREKYDVTIIPLTIVFGEEQLLDGVDISATEFYERLVSDTTHPTTSQPTPNDVVKVFESARDKGAEAIFCILISSAMSGTYASAEQAAKDFTIPVEMFDSRNNSMGLGWQIMAAARAREDGGGLKEMTAAAAKVRDKMVYHILLDTIEYLSKGGRIGEAVKLVDSVLQVKPIVTVKPESGTVGLGLPARSRKVGLKNLYKNFFRKVGAEKNLHIAILHNNVPETAEQIAERVRAEYDPTELIIQTVSPILGVHTGPRAVALCGYSE